MNMVWVDCEGTIWETEIKRTFFAAGASEPFPVNYPQGTFWAWHFPQLALGSSRRVLLSAGLDSGAGSSISQGVAFIESLRLVAQTSTTWS